MSFDDDGFKATFLIVRIPGLYYWEPDTPSHRERVSDHCATLTSQFPTIRTSVWCVEISGPANRPPALTVTDQIFPPPVHCPCNLHVLFTYHQWKDRALAARTLALIMELGEYVDTVIAGKHYNVSRHCIALHGISADRLADYGFEEVRQVGDDEA